MAGQWTEKVTGSLEEKKRYRRYRARAKELPEPYRSALEAVDRYLLRSGQITRGDTLVVMLEDLVDLFEQTAASGTPVRDVVGEDPVEFADAFLRNYAEGQWGQKERARLTDAIDRAAAQDTEQEPRPR